MERRGSGYNRLRQLNPESSWPPFQGLGTCPFRKDSVRFYCSGIFRINAHDRDPDGPPMLIGAGIADTSTGVHAFAALGYALYRRSTGGIASISGWLMRCITCKKRRSRAYRCLKAKLSRCAPVATMHPPGWNIQRPQRLDRVLLENQIANLWAALPPEPVETQDFRTIEPALSTVTT